MSNKIDKRIRRAMPEVDAGGYTRYDGTVEFYQRVSSLIGDDAVVVDFGAGRGKFAEEPLRFRRDLQRLRGRARHVVGVDVDDAVLENPEVDEAFVVSPGGTIPLADGSVDVIVSDYTFEHVQDPAPVAAELDRILKPGGWICARTPNKWGSTGIPTRIVPNSLHDRVLERVQPDKQQRDTFPTAYRLNDTAALHRHFPPSRFRHCSYTHEPEPAYFGRSTVAWSLFRALAAVTPPPLRSIRMIFLQKR